MRPSSFPDQIAAAIEAAEVLARERSRAHSGPFELDVGFAYPTLGADYLRALLPPRGEGTRLRLSVIGREQLDLTHLVPRQSLAGRVFHGERHVASWVADEDAVLYLFDRVAQRGLVWLASGSAPAWELSRPACAVINAASLDGPAVVAHGAGVGRDERVLMLAGKGHSGKTSAALACLLSGWDYAGDDYLYVDSDSGEVAPLYRSARLREDMAARFAGLLRTSTRSVSRQGGDTRHELDLGLALAPERVRGGRIAAIVLPRRRGAARVEFAPASPSDAFHALFTTTLFSTPGPMENYARKLAALVARAPVYFVDTGPEPAAIPPAFEDFLARL